VKFKSHEGKMVVTPKGVIKFRHGEYETTDKDEIEALKGARDVSAVEAKAQPKTKE
jgi:hypothetical protein